MATQTKTQAKPAPANVPASPKVEPVGKSVKGNHINLWRDCRDFQPSDTLELLTETNKWAPSSPGFRFHAQVLAQHPKTVQAAFDLGAKLTPPMKAAEIQGHLRWIYTDAGRIRIAGKTVEEDTHGGRPRRAKKSA